MRMPWTRAREARVKRQQAEARLAEVRAQRPAAELHAAEAVEHIRVNNIAEKVYSILDGRR